MTWIERVVLRKNCQIICLFFGPGFFLICYYRQCQRRGRLALSEVIACEKGKSKSRRQLHMICVFPSTFIIASGISVSFMKDLLDAFHYTWNLFETLGSGNSHGKSGETWLQRSFFKRHQRVKPLQFLSVKCDHGCVALKVPKLIRYKRQRPTYFGSLISRMLNWIWMDTNWY